MAIQCLQDWTNAQQQKKCYFGENGAVTLAKKVQERSGTDSMNQEALIAEGIAYEKGQLQQQINSIRKQNGMTELAYSTELDAVATACAEEMSENPDMTKEEKDIFVKQLLDEKFPSWQEYHRTIKEDMQSTEGFLYAYEKKTDNSYDAEQYEEFQEKYSYMGIGLKYLPEKNACYCYLLVVTEVAN